MKTVVIQIGNSDNKLTQQEWSKFVCDVQNALILWEFKVRFSGASASTAPWQNACWVVESGDKVHLDRLRMELGLLCESYGQDSIALTIGDTEFVSGRYKP